MSESIEKMIGGGNDIKLKGASVKVIRKRRASTQDDRDVIIVEIASGTQKTILELEIQEGELLKSVLEDALEDCS